MKGCSGCLLSTNKSWEMHIWKEERESLSEMHIKWKSRYTFVTGDRTTEFADIIWCSSVDFSGAILVYTCRNSSPESLGMRI